MQTALRSLNPTRLSRRGRWSGYGILSAALFRYRLAFTMPVSDTVAGLNLADHFAYWKQVSIVCVSFSQDITAEEIPTT
jgi:hypothetical protein